MNGMSNRTASYELIYTLQSGYYRSEVGGELNVSICVDGLDCLVRILQYCGLGGPDT